MPSLARRGFVLFLLLAACQAPSATRQKQIQERGELVFLTRNAPTSYYQGRHGPAGLEHDLAQAFASSLGVKARFVMHNSATELLRALRDGQGDVVAAGLTRTAAREKDYLFGPNYQKVQQEVVCHRRGKKPPKAEKDLVDIRLEIMGESSYEERLRQIRTRVPQISWSVSPDLSTEQIMENVAKRQIDCTVADSNIVAINRRYFPELVVAFPLGEEESLAWVMRPHDRGLAALLAAWFGNFGQRLPRLREHYYGHVQIFDYVDVKTFARRARKRLPAYERLFRRAARKHEFPWTLLAAQAYQESHWDPQARSPTGVEGIMMLTKITAKSLGVTDRNDPAQSIHGGARYLRRMEKRLPAEIQEPDRTWIALAAYNVGLGHVQDAQALAKRLEKNPHKWLDLRSVLPLLSQKKYYPSLKYGYARGTEPVRYVRRIRNYREILEKKASPQSVRPKT